MCPPAQLLTGIGVTRAVVRKQLTVQSRSTNSLSSVSEILSKLVHDIQNYLDTKKMEAETGTHVDQEMA